MPDLVKARQSLSVFAKVVGQPLADWQARSLALKKRTTVIVAPRQSGKSRSLSVLALHRAFAMPGLRVLVISAGDEAAKRLLGEVRRVAMGSPLLRGSVIDDLTALVTLTNGSEIRSVPASERQIRGWSVDLLLIDESALVSDELISAAAFPTTAARPDARIVLASSATAASGVFYDFAIAGQRGSEHIETFSWALADATWISPSVIEAARETMTPSRFAAEYEGVFASGADALFPRALLERATADYIAPGLHGLGKNAGLAGVDWGATQDRSALVAVSRFGSPSGVFGVSAAHAWRSGEPLDGPGGVIGQIAALPARFEQVAMETNGLGLPLAQALERRLKERSDPNLALEFIYTSQASKAATYSALRMFMEQGRLVLPASATELLRELLLLRVEITAGGGERIEASIGHDDLCDALYLSAGPWKSGDAWRTRLGKAIEEPAPRVSPAEGDTVTTGAGIELPRVPEFTRLGGQKYGPPAILPQHLNPWANQRTTNSESKWDWPKDDPAMAAWFAELPHP